MRNQKGLMIMKVICAGLCTFGAVGWMIDFYGDLVKSRRKLFRR